MYAAHQTLAAFALKNAAASSVLCWFPPFFSCSASSCLSFSTRTVSGRPGYLVNHQNSTRSTHKSTRLGHGPYAAPLSTRTHSERGARYRRSRGCQEMHCHQQTTSKHSDTATQRPCHTCYTRVRCCLHALYTAETVDPADPEGTQTLHACDSRTLLSSRRMSRSCCCVERVFFFFGVPFAGVLDFGPPPWSILRFCPAFDSVASAACVTFLMVLFLSAFAGVSASAAALPCFPDSFRTRAATWGAEQEANQCLHTMCCVSLPHPAGYICVALAYHTPRDTYVLRNLLLAVILFHPVCLNPHPTPCARRWHQPASTPRTEPEQAWYVHGKRPRIETPVHAEALGCKCTVHTHTPPHLLAPAPAWLSKSSLLSPQRVW